MAIPASQLETWSSQGAGAGSRDTYATIKLALEAKDSGYAGKKYEVFLQGSYGNDTNVYAESDVDIVISLKTAFYRDLTLMTQPEQDAYKRAHSDSTETFAAFKAQVLRVVQDRFGATVIPGPKAIKIPAGNGRRNADVIVALDFRRYRRFVSLADQNYDDGICFFTDKGVQIANYPKQHSKNCTIKHQATNSRYKPSVRILKNMRQRLVDDGVIQKGIAPSYFLEGLLYNVPENLFATKYEDTILQTLRHVIASDRTKFVCANHAYYLLGDTPVQWPAANCQTFLDAAAKLWDNWK